VNLGQRITLAIVVAACVANSLVFLAPRGRQPMPLDAMNLLCAALCAAAAAFVATG
jgi:hypothetical protein